MMEILEYNNYDEFGRLYHKVISKHLRFSNKHRECSHDNDSVNHSSLIHVTDKYWWSYKEDSKDESMPISYTYQHQVKVYDYTIITNIINVRTRYKDGISKPNDNIEVKGFMTKG